MRWAIKKLAELSHKKDAVVSGPFGSNLKVSDYKSEGVPILRLQNIGKSFFIDKDIKYISEEKAEQLKYHSFVSGDIALAKLGIPIGKTCIIPNYLKSGIITADIVRIRPDKKIINYQYLEYFLNTDLSVSQLTSNISGATRPRVNLSDVREIKIPLPPLPEQQRLVSILDEVFSAIDKAKSNAEQNLKNTKELFESYLQGVFENKGVDWEEKTLGDVCSLITDGKHGDCENEVNSGYYFLSAKDVRNNTLLFDNARQINKSGFEETHRRTNLKPGDICMVNTGATIGRISFAPDDSRTYKSTFQKSVAVIKTIPTLINNHYCCYVLQADLKKLVKVSSGTAVPNLLLGDLKRHKINIPKTLKAQQNIVKKLDALSAETKKIEVIYQTKINNLEELKKSILQKAFSGELTTTEAALA
jgi:type I restriction enzyme S subunit